ncbi:hypothetical protein FSP39_011069 [Pinctada imbricata]|uniref:E3 ubiquitin-protein ligase RNF14 n=1 Tax=Pinctada imbricata TaxID=66713 RepID=A0AA89BX91_PINIB|nr:hypothetical protein FSP39_011069 [Pinctada imbricata]
MTEDKEEQENELLALTSIYDDSVISVAQDAEGSGGQFLACLHLPENFRVAVLKDPKNSTCVNEIPAKDFCEVSYLPPITLNFQLPAGYPSTSPPQFTLSCKWLNRKQLSRLCEKLDEIWIENEGCVIVFMWSSFLQEESFDFLGLQNPLVITSAHISKKESDVDHRAIQDIGSFDRLLPAIRDYDKNCKQQEFDKSLFTCKVCFCEKSGSQCIIFLDCSHVYCKDCMRDYFTVQIQEGNVKALLCPDDKCESQAHPCQVKDLVTNELFTKYDKLLLQTSLDTMVDVMYCPRPSCQYPVLMEKDGNMGSCPACHYVFCVLCKLCYHGLSPCKIKAEGLKNLRDEYLKADSATKQYLERRYGKQAIQLAVEESYSNEWLAEYSKSCPGCGAHIQKIDGCNKMTCMKCRSYFCWICNQELSRNNPYKHYNDPNSSCQNRLFEGIDPNDDEFDEDWFD